MLELDFSKISVGGKQLKQTSKPFQLDLSKISLSTQTVGNASAAYDANEDDTVDIRDLVRAKKNESKYAGELLPTYKNQTQDIKKYLNSANYSYSRKVNDAIEKLNNNRLTAEEQKEIVTLLTEAKENNTLSQDERTYYGQLYNLFDYGVKTSYDGLRSNEDFENVLYNTVHKTIAGDKTTGIISPEEMRQQIEKSKTTITPQKGEQLKSSQPLTEDFDMVKRYAKESLEDDSYFYALTGHSKASYLNEYNGYTNSADADTRLNFIDADEAALLVYISNTQGKEEAWNYLLELKDTLGSKKQTAEINKIKDEYERSTTMDKIGLNAYSVLTNVYETPLSAVDMVGQYLKKGKFDAYTNFQVSNAAHQNIRTITAEEIKNNVKVPVLKDLATQTYQGIMSGLDMGLGLITMGGFGKYAYTASMALGAGASKARELYARGASQAQIALGATGSAVVEFLTEKIGMDAFVDVITTKTTKSWLKQILSEGFEEDLSNIGDMIIESIVMGKNSISAVEVNRLMQEEEKSKAEAILTVAKNKAVELFWDFYAGAVSAGATGAPITALNSVNNHYYGQGIVKNNNSQQLIDIALTLPETSEAYQKAKKLKEVKGTIGTVRTGDLFVSTMNYLSEAEKSIVNEAVTAELNKLGVPNSSDLSQIIVSMARMEDMEQTDRNKVLNDSRAKKVYTELIGQYIKDANEKSGTVMYDMAHNTPVWVTALGDKTASLRISNTLVSQLQNAKAKDNAAEVFAELQLKANNTLTSQETFSNRVTLPDKMSLRGKIETDSDTGPTHELLSETENDIISNDNKTNIVRGEDNDSTDTELLGGRKISTISGSGNSIREQSENTRKISAFVEGISKVEGNGRSTLRAGDSGWLVQQADQEGKIRDRFEEGLRGKILRIAPSGFDTIGRKISNEIKEKFKDTVFKDESGNLLSLYHWTQATFEAFAKGEFGFHFGTLDAARDRYIQSLEENSNTQKGFYKEVYLNIKHPYFMAVDAGVWSAQAVALQLEMDGLITEQQYDRLSITEGFWDNTYDNPAANAVREILAQNGYDGIVYKNDSEDAGSYSVIALYPDQIITVAENGVLKEGNGVTETVPAKTDSNTDYELADNDMYAKDPSQWSAENKNDTAVSKSLKDKLAGLFGKGSQKKTVSISEIVKQIEKDFNVPVSKGKFRQKAYGIYKNKSQAIRTKVTNALPTIAHELGHHIDNKHHLTQFESIGEAERILKETRPDFYNSYKPEARPREAVAEFMRDYLADRTMAKEKYPFFYEEFERRLSESADGKTDLENLKAIGDKINQYYTAELRERAQAAIISRKEAKRLAFMETKLSDVLERMETLWLDDGAAFKRISQKAYDLYYWAKKSSVRAKNTLTGYYMAGFGEDVVKQRDKNGNVLKDENGKELLVPALKYVLSTIEEGRMYNDFNEYLTYRHGIEWLKQDLRVFADDSINNQKYMTEQAARLERQYPHFKETAEKLYDWYGTFVYEYGVKSGLMTKEQYKTLVEKYPCYVPFMRNIEAQNKGFAKSGIANQNAPLKRAKGSGLEIHPPIESLVIKIEQFMKAADRNAVMQKIADTVDVEGGFGWLLEEVPPDMIPNTISSDIIKSAAKKTLKNSGMDDGAADEFSHLIDILIGESITDFKIGQIQGENVVAVRRNGKRTLYQVHDKDLLAALTGLGVEQFDVFTQGMGKATKLFKALTTGSNAVWSIVSNAPRDFDSAYKYGSENNPIKYTVDYIKAVASQFGKQDSEIMKLYRTLGGGYNNSFANARELQNTTRGLLSQHKTFADRVKGLFNIIDNVTMLADFVETAPRLAEFKRVYERTGDAKKAMLAAEEVTINFNRSGKFAKRLDQYIPYFNASIQGNAKYAKAIAASLSKNGDRSFLIKSIVTAIIKTGLTFGILGLYGDEGEEEYEKLSAYKKNNFYNIYLGKILGEGKWLSIPKSQATGVFDSLLERVFEIAMKDDAEWGQEVKDFAGYMWLTFGPPLIDDMIVGSTILDLAKNEDFTGAPIVSSYYEGLEPEMQYNEKTTFIAKAIGQLFGWSPMKIDHVIESNFGVFGLLNKSLGREEKDWTLGTKTKVITDSAYSTDILNNFYNKAEDYAVKAKSYPDNAEYVYKDKQYTAVKSIVSALNSYGKEDPAVAREFKILARDYVDSFEKDSKVSKKLLELLESTGDDDVLYDRTFKPTYSINKVEYKMEPDEFMDFVDEYYEEVQKEYEDILDMNLSDEATAKMLIKAKDDTYKRVAKDYKIKR